ncbi:MAG: hypothetical protein JST84_27850 [Acidobacteria bacterium]|nr:hypothetical protein [Acidobacteriota bacterium]
MSAFDSQDLMEINAAAREYDVPALTFQLAIKRGALRTLEIDGSPKLFRHDVEQFVKRTIKRGAGNVVVAPIRRNRQ